MKDPHRIRYLLSSEKFETSAVQTFFAVEVIAHQTHVDACLLRDLLYGCALEALLRKKDDPRADQALGRILVIERVGRMGAFLICICHPLKIERRNNPVKRSFEFVVLGIN